MRHPKFFLGGREGEVVKLCYRFKKLHGLIKIHKTWEQAPDNPMMLIDLPRVYVDVKYL